MRRGNGAHRVPQQGGIGGVMNVGFLSVAPSEGAIMAAPEGAKAPLVEGSEDARSMVRSL